jgi:nitrate reductase gamma subunit
MDQWLDFARGPLFAVSLLIMLLGLFRHVLLQVHSLSTKGSTLRRVLWRQIASDTLSWVLPFRHLGRGTRLLTVASILFHIGVILTPLFLADHVVLWEGFLGIQLPRLGTPVADALALGTIALTLVLLAYRVLVTRSRELSRPADYAILLLIVLPFATGYFASHPSVNPLPWQAMMLLHVLSAEVLFVAIPFTKLAHVVLFPFDRVSQVHWQLRTGAGERVAVALYGEEAKV